MSDEEFETLAETGQFGDMLDAAQRARTNEAELEAQCAAMRKALERFVFLMKDAAYNAQEGGLEDFLRCVARLAVDAEFALAVDAGKALLERLKKAEAELAKLESITMQEVLEPDRIQTRAKALEDAARVALECDWLGGSPEGKYSSLRETIAAAIRALKDGGT